jgi:hypothetical protein
MRTTKVMPMAVSDSEHAMLSIIFNKPSNFLDGGAACWRQLDNEQREVARKFARARAAGAERAAGSVMEPQRGRGRPKTGTAMTGKDRQRASVQRRRDAAHAAHLLAENLLSIADREAIEGYITDQVIDALRIALPGRRDDVNQLEHHVTAWRQAVDDHNADVIENGFSATISIATPRD